MSQLAEEQDDEDDEEDDDDDEDDVTKPQNGTKSLNALSSVTPRVQSKSASKIDHSESYKPDEGERRRFLTGFRLMYQI